jgi:hypothetical protein
MLHTMLHIMLLHWHTAVLYTFHVACASIVRLQTFHVSVLYTFHVATFHVASASSKLLHTGLRETLTVVRGTTVLLLLLRVETVARRQRRQGRRRHLLRRHVLRKAVA